MNGRNPHGTNAGYQAHITYKTPPCGDCHRAHATYERRRRGTELQMLEMERLRPEPPPPDPLDELFRKLIGVLAGAAKDAGWY